VSRNIAERPDRCQAKTATNHYSPRGVCPNKKSIFINGKQLCGRHASKEALAMMISDGQANVLPTIQKQFGDVEIHKSKPTTTSGEGMDG
jgi:hypothetical protein